MGYNCHFQVIELEKNLECKKDQDDYSGSDGISVLENTMVSFSFIWGQNCNKLITERNAESNL